MSADLSWHLCRFTELSVEALYAVLRLRDQVFVVEQDSVYGDVDNLDPLAWHVQGLAASGALLAYARVLPPGVKDAQAVCIGRVVVAVTARGLGLGSVLLDQALACAAQQWPGVAIMLSAQCDKQAMYARRGFVAEGAPYDDGGVLHVTMRRAG